MYFECDYKYAICIDFVTTCWDTQDLMNADAIDRQEIIGKLSGHCHEKKIQKKTKKIFSVFDF